jgi:DnaJ-domain-containing protein 1
LYSFDLYGGLGLLIPHLEIPSLTYLIIKYRTLYLYDKTVEYFLFLTAPLIWCYKKIVELIYFIKTQQKDKTNKQTDENYNYEEFKKQQKAEWEKEQAKADKQYQNKSKNKRDKQQNQNNYQKTEYSKKSKEESKENSRWDSTDPYIILDIHTTATKEEIKKAYRLLAKIYHPDLALIEKERYTKIFQKINWAYNILK